MEGPVVSWKIQRIEGTDVTDVGSLPSLMSVAEIETTLQRLLCRQLTEGQIIAASHRKEMGGHSDALERVGNNAPISFGHGEVYFIAKKEPDPDGPCS